MTERNEIHEVIDAPGYSLVYEACAKLVEASPYPKLAAAALLNAALGISLSTMGSAKLAHDLRKVVDNLPAEEARAKNQLA